MPTSNEMRIGSVCLRQKHYLLVASCHLLKRNGQTEQESRDSSENWQISDGRVECWWHMTSLDMITLLFDSNFAGFFSEVEYRSPMNIDWFPSLAFERQGASFSITQPSCHGPGSKTFRLPCIIYLDCVWQASAKYRRTSIAIHWWKPNSRKIATSLLIINSWPRLTVPLLWFVLWKHGIIL